MPIGLIFADSDLESKINAKTDELKKVHQQIEETQQQLLETDQKKDSLSKIISRSNYLINQLNLNIKSSLITIDKLGLEIKSLDTNISDLQDKIELNTKNINSLLRELQIKSDESLVEMFLKKESLAEGLGEIQNYNQLRNSLIDNTNKLKNLKVDFHNKLESVSSKKNKVEIETKSAQIKKSILNDEHKKNKQLLTLTKIQADIYEKQLDDLAQRQEEIAKEIEDLEANLRKQINTSLLPAERPGVLAWPVQGYRKITQGYGATSFARIRYRGKWHNGIDISAPLGTPILAVSDGFVTNSGNQDQFCYKGAYGRYIVIRHLNNLTTLYAHLSKISVNPGDRINRGDVIGYIGTTGYSTGPHLHLTVYDSNTFQMRPSRVCGLMPSGGDINPNKYL